MDRLQAALLGLVQGVTEFLPVSSSGHLVLFQEFLGIEQEGILFEVVVHVATLVAVLIFYRRRVKELSVGAARASPETLRYLAKLCFATLPVVGTWLAVGPPLERLFETPAPVGAALLVTGFLLFSTRVTRGRGRAVEPGWGGALAIGCAQAVALVPGISRSGATVSVALALGMAPTAAAEFSFLMSVIAIVGAMTLQLGELAGSSSTALAGVALAGALALASGLASLWLFVRLLRGRSFHRFAYYTWALGGAVLAWHWLAG